MRTLTCDDIISLFISKNRDMSAHEAAEFLRCQVGEFLGALQDIPDLWWHIETFACANGFRYKLRNAKFAIYAPLRLAFAGGRKGKELIWGEQP